MWVLNKVLNFYEGDKRLLITRKIMHIIHNSNKTDIPVYIQYSTANQPLTDDGVYSSHSRP